jgi:hypothetical protein
MTAIAIPPSVTIAALLKSQLDQGKDYFDLLLPFVHQALSVQHGDIIDPVALRGEITKRFGLELPLRTLVALLDRIARRDRGGIRKEGGAYLKTAKGKPEPEVDATALISDFERIGETFAEYSKSRLKHSINTEGALELLCGFLETHSATLVLDETPSTARTDRREDIVVASFLSSVLGKDEPSTTAVSALLQGLILARAVTLTDLAEIERRLTSLAVYFDTPFVLSLAGLHGDVDHEAARDAVRLLKELGAVPAVFDVTIAEVRRILTAFEHKLDTSNGRQTLFWSPLTAHLLSVNATASDVRTHSALLEATLTREGLMVHATPPREREFVADEAALAHALTDERGEAFAPRQQHDVDCVAAILTLRRDRQPDKLENARAIFAASGKVVRRTIAWWSETRGKGLPPILEHAALINYCWLKRPRSALTIHRFEMAALCTSILQPSVEAWDRFRNELRRMADNGLISREEAAVILVDSYASKLLTESEETETIGPGTVSDIVDRVREEQKRETEHAKAEAVKEREARIAAQSEAESRVKTAVAETEAVFSGKLATVADQLTYERTRSEGLERSVASIARFLSWILTFPVLGVAIVAIAVIAVFPFISASSLPPAARILLQTLTVLLSFAGGAFGLSAVALGRALQQRVERKIRKILLQPPPSSTE